MAESLKRQQSNSDEEWIGEEEVDLGELGSRKSTRVKKNVNRLVIDPMSKMYDKINIIMVGHKYQVEGCLYKIGTS